MKVPSLVHISAAPKMASTTFGLPQLKTWMAQATSPVLSAFAVGLAAIGLGVMAEKSSAQVIYFPRPISTTVGSGVVSTNSGIGLNVRSGPGLSFPIIGGASDGASLVLVGSPVFADGYRWQRVSTGGWVASDFVSGGFVNISTGNGCLREISACGGDSEVIISRPIVITRPPTVTPTPPIAIVPPSVGGSYVAAVPGGQATLFQVQRVIPNARLDRAREGSFVNAGSFPTHDGAQSVTSFLRASGFDARVIHR
jgi:hypothetical protein